MCYWKMFRNNTLKMVNFEHNFRKPIGHGQTSFLKDFHAQTYDLSEYPRFFVLYNEKYLKSGPSPKAAGPQLSFLQN